MIAAGRPRYAMVLSVGPATSHGAGNLESAGQSWANPFTPVPPMAATPATPSRFDNVLAGMRYRAMKMAPTPEELEMMDRVKANVFSWLVIAGIGGVIFLAYKVPNQLNTIERNQESLKTVAEQHARELTDLRERAGQLERSILGPRR